MQDARLEVERDIHKDDRDWEPREVEPIEVPAEYAFWKFREHAGWQDDRVLGRQPIWRVEFAYRVYQLEIKFGAF